MLKERIVDMARNRTTTCVNKRTTKEMITQIVPEYCYITKLKRENSESLKVYGKDDSGTEWNWHKMNND